MLKAEELYKKSLVDEPNNEYSLMSLTELYMNRGSLDSANLYIDQLLKIYPSYESALNMKGWIGIQLFDKKKDTKALEESRVAFEKSFKVNFKFAYGYYGLAMVYIRMNNLVKAIDVLEEALKVNPGFQQGAELLNQLKNATAQQGGM
jgi:tetratricopeptide (TPR) repeat protein